MRVHEYLRILVINSKIVTYEYFMDDITENEIIMLLRLSNEAYRDAWERTRYMVYYNAVMSGNLKKQYAQKGMYELFPLPYDEDTEQHRYDITNSEITELKMHAQHMEEIFKKRKNKSPKKVDGK